MSVTTPQAYYKVLPGQYDLFALVARDPRNFPALLQSTAQSRDPHSRTARYDILFAYPGQTLRKLRDGQVYLDGQRLDRAAFLPALDAAWRAQRATQSLPADLPFRGGWLIYLGYELAGEIEPVLDLPQTGDALPIAQAQRVGAAVIYDHARAQTLVVAEPQWAAHAEALSAQVLACGPLHTDTSAPVPVLLEEETPQRYLDSVDRILSYIREGDVFQVNLSRRWQAQFCIKNIPALYRRLCTANPGPFAGYMHFEEGCILSSSPERLVEVRTGRVATRPIAGTRPRNPDPLQDAALINELINHPKERAEHVMLIDLERNDLGRICIPGTVQVDERMIVESYAHVHHIVSNVTGTLRADVTPADVIAAVFPGGTITGCPKVRCMQIIAELEGEARGAYTGSFGYLNHNGDMDLNILIRSMVHAGEQLTFRAGAGIVVDSIPARELDETRAKARGMQQALIGARA